MSRRLNGKVAIVTGAAAGIGEAIALLMGQEGARVVVADVDEQGGEETAAAIRAAGGEAIFVRTDVSREEEVAEMTAAAVRAFGGVDVLVNNAAVFVLKGVEASPEDWQRSLSVNVVGNSLCTRYAAAEMKKRGGGAI
ncbi:MAG TPA: SDR family NAD(P)-dependent oxidoreductase, partial [Longimicrobiaceae bacterium]